MQDIMDQVKKTVGGGSSGGGDLENAQDGEGKEKRGKKKASTGKESDVVEQCMQAYEENKRPRKLGKMFAFWYNGKN